MKTNKKILLTIPVFLLLLTAGGTLSNKTSANTTSNQNNSTITASVNHKHNNSIRDSASYKQGKRLFEDNDGFNGVLRHLNNKAYLEGFATNNDDRQFVNSVRVYKNSKNSIYKQGIYWALMQEGRFYPHNLNFLKGFLIYYKNSWIDGRGGSLLNYAYGQDASFKHFKSNEHYFLHNYSKASATHHSLSYDTGFWDTYYIDASGSGTNLSAALDNIFSGNHNSQYIKGYKAGIKKHLGNYKNVARRALKYQSHVNNKIEKRGIQQGLNNHRLSKRMRTHRSYVKGYKIGKKFCKFMNY